MSQLFEGFEGRVRLEDAGLGLHDLTERPERDAVAVRQAPSLAPADEIRPAVDFLAELPDESALSDAGLGDDGDELRRRLAEGTRERLAEQRELGVAADEEGLGSEVGVHPEAAARRRRSPHRYRILLAFRRDRLERLEADRALRRAHRGCVHDHRADRGCSLQARGGVDNVARDDSLASLGSCSQGDDGLTRGHCGPYGDVEALAPQLLHRLEDSQCRAHRTLGVVLVCDGRAEDGHDGVADELLDGSAEALDVGLHALVVRPQCRADVLRVGAVGTIGEADQVDEEDGHDLALLARRGLGNERVAAGQAEACALRVLLTARGADDHPRIFAASRSRRLRGRREVVAFVELLVLGEPPLQHAARQDTDEAMLLVHDRARARRPRSRGSGTPPRAGRRGRS